MTSKTFNVGPAPAARYTRPRTRMSDATARIEEWVRACPGKAFTTAMVARAVGCGRSTVNTAIRGDLARKGLVEDMGHALYRSKAPTSAPKQAPAGDENGTLTTFAEGAVFEYVGTTESGTNVARGTEGKLYAFSPL